jgi:RNA polymerase sigma-70 factor (ECF subfamily)
MGEASRSDWLAYCAGDDSAMDRIYRRFKDKLFTFCLFVTHHRALSEDIVQETFTRLMVQRKGRPEIESLSGWLFVCARNQALNCLSKSSEATSPTPVGEISATFIDPDTARFINTVLSKLDPEERDLILLREHEQFSIRELAGMLELSEEAIRVRLFRIRKKMQSLIRE